MPARGREHAADTCDCAGSPEQFANCAHAITHWQVLALGMVARSQAEVIQQRPRLCSRRWDAVSGCVALSAVNDASVQRMALPQPRPAVRSASAMSRTRRLSEVQSSKQRCACAAQKRHHTRMQRTSCIILHGWFRFYCVCTRLRPRYFLWSCWLHKLVKQRCARITGPKPAAHSAKSHAALSQSCSQGNPSR